ncbi:MAG: cysteine-rich CWC family protein [Burkholderiaceae bacterium]
MSTIDAPPGGGFARRLRCARCGARFECGRDLAACWCTSLPALRADELPSGQDGRPISDCICPDCLRAHMEAALRARHTNRGA